MTSNTSASATSSASAAAATATPDSSSSTKKPSKMKRLLSSARRKKNGISASVILPSIGGHHHKTNNNNSNKDLHLSPLESMEDVTEPHSNALQQHSSETNNPTPRKLSPPKKPLEEIATLLQSELEIRDRKYHLKTYKQCFVGSEMVDYLVENHLASSRTEAVTMGQQIMDTLHSIEHVTRDHTFKDDYLFYHFIINNNNNNNNNDSSYGKKKQSQETVPNYKRIASSGSAGSSNLGAAGGLGAGGSGGIVKMDKYGFLLDDDRCSATGSAAEEGHNELSTLRKSDAKRWESMLEKAMPTERRNSNSSSGGGGGMGSGGGNTSSHHGGGGGSLSYSTSQSKVKYYARRGLPDSLRQKAWTVLTGVDLIMNENPERYEELVQKADEEYRKMHDHESADLSLDSGCNIIPHRADGTGSAGSSVAGAAAAAAGEGYESLTRLGTVLETIERDIHRTFPKHYLFTKGIDEDKEYDDDDNDDDDGNHNSHNLDNNGGARSSGGGAAGRHDYLGSSMQSSDMMDESQNFGSDDDEYDDDDEVGGESSSGADDIINIATSTGHDVAFVVEAKKQLFNESINLDPEEIRKSVGLARIEGMHKVGASSTIAENNEEDDDMDPAHKQSFNTADTNGSGVDGSDRSLDIYDDEDDDLPIGISGRRNSNEKGGGGSSTLKMAVAMSSEPGSLALGMGHGQGALRRVLRAYCMYDSEVGYCQGMNFIAAMFLTFLSEEEAFWLLVVVMNEEPYKLRELFGEDMAGTHEVLYIAEKLLAQFLPKLSKHVEAEGIHVSMFVTQWLLTLYTSTFPFDLVSRVWDSFLVEGWKVVYRVMLSLLDSASKDILNLHFEEILDYFRDFPSTVDGKAIMSGSLKIALKRKHIQKHVNEWRRHAGGGEDQPKQSKLKRRSSDGSSVSSNTLNSDKAALITKIAPTNFLKKAVPKEIEVENLSEQLLPVIGAYKFAVILHNVLTPDECAELIDRAEENGFEDASIYDRRTNKAHRNCMRYVVDDADLADTWYERIVDALLGTPFERKILSAPWVEPSGPAGCMVKRAVGLNERLRLLRYKKDEFFHSHNDATFVRGLGEGDRAGESSHVSVQVYLNQKFKGGFTTFHGRGRHLDVKPRTGSVLLFDHNILHEGQMVTQGKKYLVRTDVMYAATAAVPVNVGFTSAASGTTLTQQL